MKRSGYLFLLCLLISLLSYLPSVGAGFVHDFVGWQRSYDQGNFQDILNCFGYQGNLQFLHLVFYTFYRIFHIGGLPWYLFFCTLHAINGFMLFRLSLKLSDNLGMKLSPVLAFAGAVLFLIHPYNVEAVVWKPCVHYLLSLMAVLAVMYLFLEYINRPGIKTLLAAGFIYFLSLFTLEIAFITPVAIILTGLVCIFFKTQQKTILFRMAVFTGVMFLLLGINLLINIMTLGSVVGHYGAEQHFQFNFLYICSTEFKYLFKHLLFARYSSFQAKEMLFDNILSSQFVVFFMMCLFLILGIIYFLKIKFLIPKWHQAFLGLFISFLFVLPVANMYFMHLHVGMNDRFSYVPMAFIILFLTAMISGWKKWLAGGGMAILLLISLYLQQKTISYWRDSTLVLKALKQDFRWHDAPYVFVLNSPDNFHGIFMVSPMDEPSRIDDLVRLQTQSPFNGEMFDVLQYNMTSVHDGVHVEQTGPKQLKVTFNQWGNWWHRNGVGAGSYENEYYKVELLDHPYLITFKQFPEGSVIIYQDGKSWKEFNMN